MKACQLIFAFLVVANASFCQSKIVLRLKEIQKGSLQVDRNDQTIVKFQSKKVDKVLEKARILSFEQAFPMASMFNHPASKRVSELCYLTYDSTYKRFYD